MKVSNEYLAGLFDGEGFITFTFKPSGYINCEVCISMNAPELTAMLQELFPESRVHSDKSKRGILKWVIPGGKADAFITALEPFVIFKKPDFAWYRRWQSLPKAQPRNMTEEILQYRLDFIKEYKEWRASRYMG